VCLLRLTGGEPFTVEAKRIVSGEANLANCNLTREGDLRASFLRGMFPDRQITRRAAHNVALAINDIHIDAIESFERAPDTSFSPDMSLKSSRETRILLESVEDNPRFVQIVQEELERINLVASRRVLPLTSHQLLPGRWPLFHPARRRPLILTSWPAYV